MQQQTKYLILAWGNPGRGDDAAGLVIAESLEGCVGGNVEIRCFHQLGPELSEDVAAADHVIFIDAHDAARLAGPCRPGSRSRGRVHARTRTPAARRNWWPGQGALPPSAARRTLVATRAFDTTFGAPCQPKRPRNLSPQAAQGRAWPACGTRHRNPPCNPESICLQCMSDRARVDTRRPQPLGAYGVRMHEMSIAAAIAEQVLAAAKDNNLAKVTQVRLRVGELRLIVPEALGAAWEAVREGTAADGAGWK